MLPFVAACVKASRGGPGSALLVTTNTAAGKALEQKNISKKINKSLLRHISTSDAKYYFIGNALIKFTI